jgi:hypothetical protein
VALSDRRRITERATPDQITLSETAQTPLRRRLASKHVPLIGQSRLADGELVDAGLMSPLHTFALGRDSAYRPTEAAGASGRSSELRNPTHPRSICLSGFPSAWVIVK